MGSEKDTSSEFWNKAWKGTKLIGETALVGVLGAGIWAFKRIRGDFSPVFYPGTEEALTRRTAEIEAHRVWQIVDKTAHQLPKEGSYTTVGPSADIIIADRAATATQAANNSTGLI